MIISFWATWCKPCKKELDAINEEYAELVKETGVKLIAISIDDARSAGKVVTDVKVKGWKYEVYIDENSDFKRAMNVNNVPHTFLVDGDGKIVWSHNSYAEGDEEKLFDINNKDEESAENDSSDDHSNCSSCEKHSDCDSCDSDSEDSQNNEIKD